MSTTDPLIGKKLGDYLIEGVLGTGGMARVYRGYDDKLDRYAAVKVIEPQLIASNEEEEYRERFLREARSIARLNHPSIVGVYQFAQIDNMYFIAMEYIEGRNLREVLKSYIKQEKLIPRDEMLRILRDIAQALDYSHKQGIIHRDIKPSNIIVRPDGSAVLTDFGLALNAIEGTIGNTFGSVHYIAPEQAISSAQANAQSDQYSLGIIAYEMVSGRVPFDDASAMSVALKHISDPPPPPTEINPDVPAEVEQIIMRTLDKDYQRRHTTCQEFVEAIADAYATPSPSPARTTATLSSAVPPSKPAMDVDAPTISDSVLASSLSPASAQPPRKSNGLLWGIGIVVLALALVGGALLLPTLGGAGEPTAVAQATDEPATEIPAVIPEVTDEPTETPTPTDEPTDTPTPTDEPTDTPTPTDEPTDTPTPTDEPTDTPTPTDEPTDTPTPTDEPTDTPTPTSTPTSTPTLTNTPTRHTDADRRADRHTDADGRADRHAHTDRHNAHPQQDADADQHTHAGLRA